MSEVARETTMSSGSNFVFVYLQIGLLVFLLLNHLISNRQKAAPKRKHSSLPIPPILTASDHINDERKHLLLAATGSVATIKLPSIINALAHHANLSIRVILTESAAEFLQGQSAEQPSLAAIAQLPKVEAIYLDRDEWLHPWTRGAPILHIELRRWADLMVIAPLSANALVKIVLGMSDTLVYSVARAWDTTGLIDAPRPGLSLPYGERRDRKGIMLAPAMNTAMWEHPATKTHMTVLEGPWNVRNGGWVEVLRPIEKDLACGDVGGGAMKEWKEIVSAIEVRLELARTPSEEGYVAVEGKMDGSG